MLTDADSSKIWMSFIWENVDENVIYKATAR